MERLLAERGGRVLSSTSSTTSGVDQRQRSDEFPLLSQLELAYRALRRDGLLAHVRPAARALRTGMRVHVVDSEGSFIT